VPFTITRTAVALAFAVDVSVRVIERMPMDTAGLASVDPRQGVSSKEVLPMRHRLQVCHLDTATVPAQVVDLQPFRNRTMLQFISHAMRKLVMTGTTPIPLGVDGTGPRLAFTHPS
jgi:hypothetical protein